tara:strand:+ start:485 stop:880 length:396 start_codon:yes stop_codon:yes gene_type:complete
MPHLQFDFNKKLNSEQKRELCNLVSISFSEIMQTSKDHIGILIREHPQDNLFLGQVNDKSDGILLANIDLRSGRSENQMEDFKNQIMQGIKKITQVPIENMYIVYSQHQGNDFRLSNRNLNDWFKNENGIR